MNDIVDFGAVSASGSDFRVCKGFGSGRFSGAGKGVVRREWFVTDGKVYDSHAFAELIRKELGIRG